MHVNMARSIVIMGLTLFTLICCFIALDYLQIPTKVIPLTILSVWSQGNSVAVDKNNTCLPTSCESPKIDSITCGSTISLNESEEFDVVKNTTIYVTVHGMGSGGLGNQMFRYASLLGIARAHRRQFFISPGSQLQNTFKIQYIRNYFKAIKRWTILNSYNGFSFDENMTHLPCENIIIKGDFQSYKYFHSVVDVVRQEFVFLDSVANQADAILHDLHAKYKGSLFVGVHVRRGDFLAKRLHNSGFRVAAKSYFVKAFDWMKSKFPERNVTFLVASSDFKWCNENLKGKNVVVLPPAAAAVHMAILSRCEHMIITGGTFGWWSGWLASGYVIYYKDYLPKGTPLGDLLHKEDYYPRLWIGFGD